MKGYLNIFFCVSGDVDNVLLSKPGCFGVEDSSGLLWHCIPQEDIDEDSLRDAFATLLCDIQQMHDKLETSGIGETDGTRCAACILRYPEPITEAEKLDKIRNFLDRQEDDLEGEEWKSA